MHIFYKNTTWCDAVLCQILRVLNILHILANHDISHSNHFIPI